MIDPYKEKFVANILTNLEKDPEKLCYNLGSENSLDFPIFRFISLDKLFEMLTSNTILLVRTTLWEDVYENFFLKKPMKLGSSSTSLRDLMDGMYGQCWTKLAESDALWRIYSSDCRSVRISTTLKKLLLGIINAPEFDPKESFGISTGIVSYHTQEYLDKITENIQFTDILDSVSKYIIGASFLKRVEFIHEQEVRIIAKITVTRDYNENKKAAVKHYTINSNELIDNVLFDPRCDESFFGIYSRLVQKIGFEKPVGKSKLYEF